MKPLDQKWMWVGVGADITRHQGRELFAQMKSISRRFKLGELQKLPTATLPVFSGPTWPTCTPSSQPFQPSWSQPHTVRLHIISLFEKFCDKKCRVRKFLQYIFGLRKKIVFGFWLTSISFQIYELIRIFVCPNWK